MVPHTLLWIPVGLLFQINLVGCYSYESYPSMPSTIPSISFFPPKYEGILEQQLVTFYYNITTPNSSIPHGEWKLTLSRVNDPEIVTLVSINSSASEVEGVHNDGSVTVKGNIFGRTLLQFEIQAVNTSQSYLKGELYPYEVSVIRKNTMDAKIFMYVLGCLIVFYNVGFGCKIRASHIIDIIKKPIGPIIGLVCQFTIMAPVSFGVAKMLQLDAATGMGVLAIGSSPGGGGSNVFAYLLNADLEMSITMTFISSLVSIGATPLWIKLLGHHFVKENPEVKIPFLSVLISLAINMTPVVVGAILGYFKPAVAKKVAWCLKPMTALMSVLFLGGGVYVYWFSLRRASWQTVVACMIIPIIGYTCGFLAAKIFRQKLPRAISISLETGFQNLALAMLMLTSSLHHPELDMAGVVPILYSFCSIILPTLFLFTKSCFEFYKKRKEAADKRIDEDGQSSSESSLMSDELEQPTANADDLLSPRTGKV